MGNNFPKKCRICGLMRLNMADRPCQLKEKTSVKEAREIEEKCPAAMIMYA